MIPATHPPDLYQLLPHRPPMLLIDAVLGTDQKHLWALVQIRSETAFCEAHGVPTVISLEYLGQAAAAFFGLQDGLQDGLRDSLVPQGDPGMLVSCPTLQVDRPFFVPDCNLLIRIIATHGLTESPTLVKFAGEIAVVDASMQPATTELAEVEADWPAEPAVSGNLSVYLPPSPLGA